MSQWLGVDEGIKSHKINGCCSISLTHEISREVIMLDGCSQLSAAFTLIMQAVFMASPVCAIPQTNSNQIRFLLMYLSVILVWSMGTG